MKNYILITGGAGFVGSNLIELLLKKTNKKILSLDNYSTGKVSNHIKSKKIKYIRINGIEKVDIVSADQMALDYEKSISDAEAQIEKLFKD